MSVRYLFNTAGNYVAFQQGTNVFSPAADWLGFVLRGNQLYATDGKFLGYLLDDDRVARNKKEVKPPIGPLSRPLRPLRPLKPLKPLRRLPKLKLPYPYEDVFGDGVTGAEAGSLEPHVPLAALADSELYGADNKRLGKVNKNQYDRDSLSNQFGPYGNPFSPDSLFNDFSPYGNPFSQLSPYNEFTRTPPRFVKDGKVIAYLTVNQFVNPRVDPTQFKAWLGRG